MSNDHNNQKVIYEVNYNTHVILFYYQKMIEAIDRLGYEEEKQSMPDRIYAYNYTRVSIYPSYLTKRRDHKI